MKSFKKLITSASSIILSATMCINACAVNNNKNPNKKTSNSTTNGAFSSKKINIRNIIIGASLVGSGIITAVVVPILAIKKAEEPKPVEEQRKRKEEELKRQEEEREEEEQKKEEERKRKEEQERKRKEEQERKRKEEQERKRKEEEERKRKEEQELKRKEEEELKRKEELKAAYKEELKAAYKEAATKAVFEASKQELDRKSKKEEEERKREYEKWEKDQETYVKEAYNMCCNALKMYESGEVTITPEQLRLIQDFKEKLEKEKQDKKRSAEEKVREEEKQRKKQLEEERKRKRGRQSFLQRLFFRSPSKDSSDGSYPCFEGIDCIDAVELKPVLGEKSPEEKENLFKDAMHIRLMIDSIFGEKEKADKAKIEQEKSDNRAIKPKFIRLVNEKHKVELKDGFFRNYGATTGTWLDDSRITDEDCTDEKMKERIDRLFVDGQGNPLKTEGGRYTFSEYVFGNDAQWGNRIKRLDKKDGGYTRKLLAKELKLLDENSDKEDFILSVVGMLFNVENHCQNELGQFVEDMACKISIEEGCIVTTKEELQQYVIASYRESLVQNAAQKCSYDENAAERLKKIGESNPLYEQWRWAAEKFDAEKGNWIKYFFSIILHTTVGTHGVSDNSEIKQGAIECITREGRGAQKLCDTFSLDAMCERAEKIFKALNEENKDHLFDSMKEAKISYQDFCKIINNPSIKAVTQKVTGLETSFQDRFKVATFDTESDQQFFEAWKNGEEKSIDNIVRRMRDYADEVKLPELAWYNKGPLTDEGAKWFAYVLFPINLHCDRVMGFVE